MGQMVARYSMMAKLALAGIAIAAITTGAKFEAAMANVAAISGATAKELQSLTMLARGLGENTAFSASQASDAMTALAQAGQKVGQITRSVGSVLLYAGAAGTTMGDAAETLVQTLATFGLQATESDRVINVFAASMTKSLLNAERLREAMSQVGATAAAMNMDLEHTTGALAILHNAGQLGAIAGTRLKNVLVRLAAPNTMLKKLLGDVAFTGDNLGEVMEHLAKRGATAGEVFQAFGRIAGPAALTLMRAGADEMDKMTKSITGTTKAQDMFAIQMDTVSKRFAIFKSAAQENMIAVFMALEPQISGFITTLTAGMKKLKPIILGVAIAVGDWIKRHQGLVKTMGKVVLVFGAVILAVALFKAAIMTAIVVAIAAVIEYRDVVADALGKAWDWAKTWATNVWNVLKWPFVKLKEYVGKAIDWIDKMIPGTKKAFEAMAEAQGDAVQASFAAGFKPIGDTISAVGGAFDRVVDAGAKAATKIKEKFNEEFAQIKAIGTAAGKTTKVSMGASEEDAQKKAFAAFTSGYQAMLDRKKAADDKALKDSIAAGLAASEERKAAFMETIAFEGSQSVAALAAKNALIQEEYEAKLDAAQGNAEKIMQAEIERAEATAQARMEFEDAVYDRFYEKHFLWMDMLSAGWDTFFDTILEKEMTGKKRREAIWKSMQKSFINNIRDMTKWYISETLRGLLVTRALKENEDRRERVASAKLGAVKAFQAFAGIPFIGPALGAIAAAAAFAYLMAFQTGGLVPGGGETGVPAIVHPGEYVVRERAVRGIGAENLEYMNRRGEMPATVSGGNTFVFEISGSEADADSIAETIKSNVIPVLEDALEGGVFVIPKEAVS
jgi:TP901 family phage tail tape measure protein